MSDCPNQCMPCLWTDPKHLRCQQLEEPEEALEEDFEVMRPAEGVHPSLKESTYPTRPARATMRLMREQRGRMLSLQRRQRSTVRQRKTGVTIRRDSISRRRLPRPQCLQRGSTLLP